MNELRINKQKSARRCSAAQYEQLKPIKSWIIGFKIRAPFCFIN